MGNFENKRYIKIPEEPELKYEAPDFDKILDEIKKLESMPRMGEKEIVEDLSTIRDYFQKKAMQCIEESDNASIRTFVNKQVIDILYTILERAKSVLGDEGNFRWLNESDVDFMLGKNSDGAYATYNSFEHKIELSEEAKGDANPLVVLAELMYAGYSQFHLAIHHEVIHAEQNEFKKDWHQSAKNELGDILLNIQINKATESQLKDILAKLNSKLRETKDKKILKESQAYAGSDLYANFYDTARSLLDQLKNKYKIDDKDVAEVDKFISAYQGVKRLYSLGLSDSQIGELVKGSRWDKSIAEYDRINEKVKELLKEKKIDEEDVDNMVLYEDLKKKKYVLTIMHIAQEEIKRVVGNIKRENH